MLTLILVPSKVTYRYMMILTPVLSKVTYNLQTHVNPDTCPQKGELYRHTLILIGYLQIQDVPDTCP